MSTLTHIAAICLFVIAPMVDLWGVGAITPFGFAVAMWLNWKMWADKDMLLSEVVGLAWEARKP